MGFISLLSVICLIFISYRSVLICDKILKYEYEYHNEHWVLDGRPSGFFWHPPEAYTMAGSIARNRVTRKWLYSTPSWLSQSTEIKNAFFQLKIWVLVGSVFWLIGAVTIVWQMVQ